MDVLKVATAGSVDDGKSTLIGRILYDTKSLTDDKLEAIERNSKQKGFDYLDFSMATDGLVAEREQGITIDVAHIYFSTANRSYIIADTPGHVEYTRNMVTGASTSQVAIILIDARKGVIEQTSRHFYINNLLRVKDIVIAVNKMDLVDFSEERYNALQEEIQALISKTTYKEQNITCIPVSALQGDNVVDKSKNMSWYTGKTLIEHLEQINAQDVYEEAQTRFPVQTVIRPKTEDYHDFRGYAGKLYGGDISVGDEVIILPSETKSKVKEIYFYTEKFEKAERGSSITLTLEDDVNVSRGDMIVKASEKPTVEKELQATICWMDKKPLTAASKYSLQHGVHNVLAKIVDVETIEETNFSGEKRAISQLQLNEIGNIQLKLSKPLFFDSYQKNKHNGGFILIDLQTNTTAGVGFIN
ncbi:Bifunctional enzyme CysN/CysC [Kordia antarctica]|uniref:sulfate adenylyltransferase n=1 Tax=Kordia antarctica TaxID=1218801 RepID=A0A7L4ZNN6_9FLAO|nr:GTP-binding protein [Kordia antarctica]QHI38343.1 Bifunctional enzyme CysN/CysC [Kordia antarctica]